MVRADKKGVVLLIEGTSEKGNGDLVEGFNQLLAQELKGTMPKIIMGDSKKETIKRFLKPGPKTGKELLLLIDLDKEEGARAIDLEEHGLTNYQEWVFYMVREMEAWFISQPDILDQFYKEPISQKLPKKPAKDIEKPAQLLEKLTKNTKKGRYHKVEHAVKLLMMLDSKKLRRDFPDFDALINKLRH